MSSEHLLITLTPSGQFGHHAGAVPLHAIHPSNTITTAESRQAVTIAHLHWVMIQYGCQKTHTIRAIYQTPVLIDSFKSTLRRPKVA